jgi:hypothetical protein
MMIVVGKVFLDDGHGKWKFLTVVVELHIMKLKVEYIPLPTVNRFVTYTIFGFSLRYPGRPSVGLETFLIA